MAKRQKELPPLTRLELDVMNVAWSLGDCTSAQVTAEFTKKRLPLARGKGNCIGSTEFRAAALAEISGMSGFGFGFSREVLHETSMVQSNPARRAACHGMFANEFAPTGVGTTARGCL